jgi:hypothetical protein
MPVTLNATVMGKTTCERSQSTTDLPLGPESGIAKP